MRIEFGRSRYGYGWWLMLHVNGKHRARWTSTRGTSRTWPGFSRGADEDCNRAITIMAWPLGHLDIWWEPKWRPEGSGLCDPCLYEIAQIDRANPGGAA